MGERGTIEPCYPFFGITTYYFEKNMLSLRYLDIFYKKPAVGTEIHVFVIWQLEKLWSDIIWNLKL